MSPRRLRPVLLPPLPVCRLLLVDPSHPGRKPWRWCWPQVRAAPVEVLCARTPRSGRCWWLWVCARPLPPQTKSGIETTARWLLKFPFFWVVSQSRGLGETSGGAVFSPGRVGRGRRSPGSQGRPWDPLSRAAHQSLLWASRLSAPLPWPWRVCGEDTARPPTPCSPARPRRVPLPRRLLRAPPYPSGSQCHPCWLSGGLVPGPRRCSTGVR